MRPSEEVPKEANKSITVCCYSVSGQQVSSQDIVRPDNISQNVSGPDFSSLDVRHHLPIMSTASRA